MSLVNAPAESARQTNRIQYLALMMMRLGLSISEVEVAEGSKVVRVAIAGGGVNPARAAFDATD
jgi:hypothetical protein